MPDINDELAEVGYKIVVNRDMGSAAQSFGNDYLQTMANVVNPMNMMGLKGYFTGEGATAFDVIKDF